MVALDDPAPLRYRTSVALRSGNAALALHHARLWQAVQPRYAAPHVAVARALRAHDPPRLQRGLQVLDAALKEADIISYAERGLIEEELVRTLIDLADDASIQRAHELSSVMLSRPASRDVQRRRERMVAPLRERSAGGKQPL